MKTPKYYTKTVLEHLLPKYCKGITLDAGAGRGKYKPLITSYSTRYISIDNMSSSYQFASYLGSSVDVIGDVLRLPFINNAFHTIICTQVIEHVSEPQLLITELARVLAPGGYLILSTGWVSPYHPEPKDFYRFSIDGLSYLIDRANLRIVQIIPQGGVLCITFYWWFRLFELHIPAIYKFLVKTRVLRMCELIAEFFDEKFLTKLSHYDAVGYTVVATKEAYD